MSIQIIQLAYFHKKDHPLMRKFNRKSIKRLICAFLLLIFPTFLVRFILNALGHKIGKSTSVGLSIVIVDCLTMESKSRIGHGNLIKVSGISMGHNSRIGRQNILSGPFKLCLKNLAAIGNRNKIIRGRTGVTYGECQLTLGKLSKVTADHYIELAKSVTIGSYSILAGSGSQLWTHGYIHDLTGAGRYRVDGSITIGDNVYIGSACVITAGVSICDGAIVGAGTTVPKSLTTPDLFVSGPMRSIRRPKMAEDRDDLIRVEGENLIENVYVKK